jgi:hypothetical protein
MTIGLIGLGGMLDPSKTFGDRKSVIFYFFLGILAGIAALWTAVLTFRWLGRTPAWPLPVMLFTSLSLYNMDHLSKYMANSAAPEVASEGIGNCLGIIIGALLFIGK